MTRGPSWSGGVLGSVPASVTGAAPPSWSKAGPYPVSWTQLTWCHRTSRWPPPSSSSSVLLRAIPATGPRLATRRPRRSSRSGGHPHGAWFRNCRAGSRPVERNAQDAAAPGPDSGQGRPGATRTSAAPTSARGGLVDGSPEPDVPLTTALGRAFRLLRAFRPGDVELSLAELCRRTGIPKSTAHRQLTELEGWEVVERTPGGFRLGIRLFELGQLAPRQRGLHEAAEPVLASLREATHDTVHLAVAEGIEVVYVHKIDAVRGPALPSRVGGRMPMYCTAVGKAVLAFSTSDQVHAVVAAGLVRRTPRTVIAPGILMRQLATVRQRGIAEEHEESVAGVACVAAPVLDAELRPVAAISISGRAGRLDTARLGPAVRAAALQLSRALHEPSRTPS